MLVHLSPGVPGQEFGSGDDLTSVILTTRFEGADIGRIEEFPCFVFIALPRETWNPDTDRVTAEELQVIGWGELYRTASDAQEHRFG
ncbi:hypothetical protein [Agromyces albus]|uniref:hypothetical protein n=1 Tax=Agromyces albus TaxID=205332 RepID=UPI00278A14F7|nr:hypothetical protein [Agromyces albus]MDQ0577185.1 hypothetical protein [Agromyces albus]